MIITDERIETIVDAIIEGRAMWASVREALAILLGGNLGEIGFTVRGERPDGSHAALVVAAAARQHAHRRGAVDGHRP